MESSGGKRSQQAESGVCAQDVIFPLSRRLHRKVTVPVGGDDGVDAVVVAVGVVVKEEDLPSAGAKS